MRESVTKQLKLVVGVVNHSHGVELSVMSEVLDSCPELPELVLSDLLAGGVDPDKGRDGLTGEQVLRILIVKQMNCYSYEDLAFHLADSQSYQSFCRLGIAQSHPSSSSLQSNLKKVRASTLEMINHEILNYAQEKNIEDGKKIRSDCTVTESNIHYPTDSSLLFDCVRVLSRLLERAPESVKVAFINHTRRAKHRFIGITNAGSKKKRKPLYQDLLKISKKARGYANAVILNMEEQFQAKLLGHDIFYQEIKEYARLTACVIDQTERRVLRGESVPADEKVVSIFESHTDIIRKDRRETLYGHKLCLTAGASGLVLDCVIETGNPADSNLAVKMIERQMDIYGHSPKQAVFDGGFSSKKNLKDIKAMGVNDIVFSKAPGIALTEMVKSTKLYRRLKHFRAGVESIISFLKRSFGWDRCTWRSFESFQSYCWASVVAANTLTIARRLIE